MSLYPYHRQDLAEWCGPACIQMILEWNHLLKKHPGQRALFRAVREGSSWNAAPENILTLLNQTLPDGASYELLWKPLNPAAGSSREEAVEVLAAVKASADDGVLIPARQYRHWVVVTEAFTADSAGSDPKQLHLTVNDPWAAGGRETAHGDAPCPSGVCGASPEIWGPVRISDFLMQRGRGSLCVRRAAPPQPVDGEIASALAGAGNGPLLPEDEILDAAMEHYDFFRQKFEAELPLLTPGGVRRPAAGSSDSVATAAAVSSPYQDRWQARLTDAKNGDFAPRFAVWVEMCARTLRLSRVRYVDNQPDWWAGGGAWL